MAAIRTTSSYSTRSAHGSSPTKRPFRVRRFCLCTFSATKIHRELVSNDSVLVIAANVFSFRARYHFEDGDGWMSKHFFSGMFLWSNQKYDLTKRLKRPCLSLGTTGGTMPSFDLFSYFQKSLTLERTWWINGKHYGRYVYNDISDRWEGRRAAV